MVRDCECLAFGPVCANQYDSVFVCTRVVGHLGKHVACKIKHRVKVWT